LTTAAEPPRRNAVRSPLTVPGRSPKAAATWLTANPICVSDTIARFRAPRSAKGWPIATGIIEGACRHIVKDRMDITGARWGLEGAEAILKLRAVIATGDFGAYWRFHLRREHERIHHARYRESLVLAA
jgi:hypothetical protein